MLKAPVLLLLLAPLALATPMPGPLNVRDFGAVGDGIHDDAPAFQRAIDAAQTRTQRPLAAGNTLHVPAGTYSIHTELLVHNTHGVPRPAHLRIVGEGMTDTVIQAGSQMDAVFRFVSLAPTGSKPDGNTTNAHQMEQLSIDANRMANYSMFGAAVTMSKFRRMGFYNSLIAGVYMGYGWMNDFAECFFVGNVLIGLYLSNNANAINILQNNFEANGGIGILLNGGAMVIAEGNTIEGNGGPAIVANGIRALTIRSNYFEDNNDLETAFWGHHLEQTNLSFVQWNGSAIVGHEDVCTDVLINGPPTSFFETDQFVVAAAADMESSSPGPSHDSAPHSSRTGGQNQTVRSWQLAPIPLSNQYPCSAVTIEGNFHNPAGDRCYQERGVYAGVFATGAEGLRVMSNNCDDFHHVEGRKLFAVKTGASPMANSSFEAWAIALNTGSWAATQTEAP